MDRVLEATRRDDGYAILDRPFLGARSFHSWQGWWPPLDDDDDFEPDMADCCPLP